MNLAVVIGVFHPRGGGAERSTSQIVYELVARGHKVTVLTGYCPDSIVVPGAAIRRFSTTGNRSSLWVVGFSRWVRRQLCQEPFDASLSMMTVVPAMFVQPRSGTVRETLARNIAMRPSAIKRFWKRLLVKLSFKQQLLLAMERRTLADPAVKMILPGSRYVARQLQDHYGINDSRVCTIPNAAEMPRIDTEQRRAWRHRVRSGFGIPDDVTVYLFAAYNPRLKGINPLLNAAQRLKDRGIRFTLLLSGAIGYAQQQACVALGIRDQVRIVATTNQMAQLYAAADVTVHPTFYDPSSKVVIESLMMGTPAISTSFNGASDLILGAPGGSPRGRVIQDPADVGSLTAAMIELADPQQRQQCVIAMNGMAESLSVRRHVDQLEALMAQVTQPGSPQ